MIPLVEGGIANSFSPKFVVRTIVRTFVFESRGKLMSIMLVLSSPPPKGFPKRRSQSPAAGPIFLCKTYFSNGKLPGFCRVDPEANAPPPNPKAKAVSKSLTNGTDSSNLGCLNTNVVWVVFFDANIPPEADDEGSCHPPTRFRRRPPRTEDREFFQPKIEN